MVIFLNIWFEPVICSRHVLYMYMYLIKMNKYFQVNQIKASCWLLACLKYFNGPYNVYNEVMIVGINTVPGQSEASSKLKLKPGRYVNYTKYLYTNVKIFAF